MRTEGMLAFVFVVDRRHSSWRSLAAFIGREVMQDIESWESVRLCE
jgi:hypothetical protein